MHCKKCLHYEVCVKLGKPSLYGINQEIGCSSYKDKTMIMEDVKDYPPYLDYPKPYNVQTNADRIRAMSDGEMARWLEYEGGGACAEMCGWLNWLQQPSEDGE